MNQTITRKTVPQQTIVRALPSGPVRSVTVVGMGNIGAELAETIARLEKLARVTLVDFDHYESGNIRAQNILPDDVGKPKVQVQARKMRQIAPQLQVRAFHARFEELSLSQVRSDLLVSCLDSRLARTHVNEAAFRLNVPVLDGAVNGAALQGRVAVYLPGPDAPCLECQFSDEDYAAQEQVASCLGHSQVAPTNAPAALGKFVAGMQAIEILKMVDGRWDQVLIDRQVFVDLRHHKHYVTRFCRNPNCRFDHEVWSIEKLAEGHSPKMKDRILQSFLERQHQDGLALAAQSDLVKLLPLENPLGPPQLYRVLFLCKGLVMQQGGQIIEAQQFEVGIRFNDDHLRRFDPAMVSLLAPLNVWHPNIIGPAICVGKMTPGVQLKDLIHQIYEILTYQNWASHDGLNADAMQWVRNNQALFPVDRRPLKRRVLKVQTKPVAGPEPTAPAESQAS